MFDMSTFCIILYVRSVLSSQQQNIYHLLCKYVTDFCVLQKKKNCHRHHTTTHLTTPNQYQLIRKKIPPSIPSSLESENRHACLYIYMYFSICVFIKIHTYMLEGG